MRQKYLFDDPHWELEPVKDLGSFFGALLHLVPTEAVLCLGGYPDDANESLVEEFALPNPERIPLIEFAYGQYLQITESNIKKLQELAACHAAPEIAPHIACQTEITRYWSGLMLHSIQSTSPLKWQKKKCGVSARS